MTHHIRRPFAPDATGRPRVRGHRVVGSIKPEGRERHYVATSVIITTAIITAISLAAAAVQYTQQMAAAKRQQQMTQRQMAAQAANDAAMQRAQEKAIAENAALANQNYMNETKALQERQRQSDEASAAKELDVSKQAAQAKSTALTAAGEAGVQGLSVNALLDDFTRQEVEYRFQSRTNLGYEHIQTEAEQAGLQSQAQGRIQSMKPYEAPMRVYDTHVDEPSILGAALGVASTAASAYSKNKTPEVPKTDLSTRGDYSGLSLSDRVRNPYS